MKAVSQGCGHLAQDLYRSIVERDYETIREINLNISKLVNKDGVSDFLELLFEEVTNCYDEKIFELLVGFLKCCKEKNTFSEHFLNAAIVSGNLTLAELLLKNGVRIENRADWIMKPMTYTRIFSKIKTRKEVLKWLIKNDLLYPGIWKNDIKSSLQVFDKKPLKLSNLQ